MILAISRVWLLTYGNKRGVERKGKKEKENPRL